jgi:integrase
MLTSARRGEVLGARWEMFDLEAGVWVKPSAHTKQRKQHRVPLSAPALQLLRAMRADATGPYLFPGREGRPLTDVKRSWLAVCRRAGLAERATKRPRPGGGSARAGEAVATVWRPTARLHDLRHTYASILASQGLSLPIIGALLGHTQPQTTARYAHLLDDPLREATERVGPVVAGNGPGNAGKDRDVGANDAPA